jgi:hypothetical protein
MELVQEKITIDGTLVDVPPHRTLFKVYGPWPSGSKKFRQGVDETVGKLEARINADTAEVRDTRPHTPSSNRSTASPSLCAGAGSSCDLGTARVRLSSQHSAATAWRGGQGLAGHRTADGAEATTFTKNSRWRVPYWKETGTAAAARGNGTARRGAAGACRRGRVACRS